MQMSLWIGMFNSLLTEGAKIMGADLDPIAVDLQSTLSLQGQAIGREDIQYKYYSHGSQFVCTS